MFCKRIVYVSIILGLLSFGGLFIWQSPRGEPGSIRIKGIKINVELADTADKKSQGLSGRSELGENQGMLFLYDKPGFYSFWMKNMQFSIDIIWIDENYKVIDITKSLPPDSFPGSFQSQYPVQYVLEVNAGFSRKNNITIGDVVAGLQLE